MIHDVTVVPWELLLLMERDVKNAPLVLLQEENGGGDRTNAKNAIGR